MRPNWMDEDGLEGEKGVYEDPTQYFHMYFNVAYYLCAVPFRFHHAPSFSPNFPPADFVLKKSLAQQVICYVSYAFCILKYLPCLSSTKQSSARISSFDLVAVLTNVGVRTSFIYVMTTKEREFLAILNFLREHQLLQRKRRAQKLYAVGKVSWGVGFVSVFYSMIGVVYVVLGITKSELRDWSAEKVWASYVGEARFHVFRLERNQPVHPNDITTADHVGTALFLVLKILNLVGAHFVGNGFFVLALLFHHLARDFRDFLNNNTNLAPLPSHTVIASFWRFRTFVKDRLNAVFGSVLVFWVLEGILYYSSYLDAIFNETNRFHQLRNVIYISNFIATLLLAADAHHKVSAMKDWIMERQERMRLLSESELVVILNALSPSDVGLKAFGFFTVTYEFIATMTHVIITYAVIISTFAHGDERLCFYGYSNLL